MLDSDTYLIAGLTIPASLTPDLHSIPVNLVHTSGLHAGQTEHLIDVMYAMLLPRAYNAASVLAVDSSGCQAAITAHMNVRSSHLGCKATHLLCPHGLNNSGYYSTARDMANIMLASYTDPTYRQMTETVSYILPATMCIRPGRSRPPTICSYRTTTITATISHA